MLSFDSKGRKLDRLFVSKPGENSKKIAKMASAIVETLPKVAEHEDDPKDFIGVAWIPIRA